MVWQEKASVIVMLCRLLEDQNKLKCWPYWHHIEGRGLGLGQFVIWTKSQEAKIIEDQKVIVTELQLDRDSEERALIHVQHLSWPDRKTPQTGFPVVAFLSKMRQYHYDVCIRNGFDPRNCPKIVHCSAGIGRTGTLVAIELSLRQLDKEKTVDIAKIVRKIREQRAQAVQSVDQYMFIYQVLLEKLVRNKHISPGILDNFRREAQIKLGY